MKITGQWDIGLHPADGRCVQVQHEGVEVSIMVHTDGLIIVNGDEGELLYSGYNINQARSITSGYLRKELE